MSEKRLTASPTALLGRSLKATPWSSKFLKKRRVAPDAGRAMHGEPLGWLGGWAQCLCTTAQVGGAAKACRCAVRGVFVRAV